MARWRVVVHALDRTGPPVLARTFLRWLAATRPDDDVDVVAVRGGALLGDMVHLADVHVVLEPREAWDPDHLDPARVKELTGRLSTLETPDATLLVSVAGAQVLPLLDDDGPVVTWVVEQGEDLHWLDAPLGLRQRTTRWLAGSESSRAELHHRLPDTPVELTPEFVEDPGPVDCVLAGRCRRSLGANAGDLVVVGAGIATRRKAPDLFLEVALAQRRAGGGPGRFAWFGGEQDDLHRPLRAEAERLGLDQFSLVESVPDLTPWLAAADVFLHTARLDAFPLVCLHASLAGTPVVTFRGVGGTDEMFGDDAAGAEYPDVEAMALVLESLRDPARAADLAGRQAARVRARSTADVCAPVLLDHLLAAAGARHG